MIRTKGPEDHPFISGAGGGDVGKRVLCFFLIIFNLSVLGLPAAAVPVEWEIKVNIPAYRLTVYQNGEVYGSYPIAVGKPGNETPVGEFAIVRKVKNPVWYPPRGGAPVPSGPANPLGYRWLEYRTPGYGIHGTSNPASIGHAVSLGCIRMNNRDVEALYEVLPVGTPVRIVYETVTVETDGTTGEIRVRAYSDIYGKGTTTAAVLQEKLAAAGYTAMPSEAELLAILAQATAAPVYLAGSIAVELNDRVLAADAFVAGGLLLVPLKALGEALNVPFTWDGGQNKLMVGGREVAACYRNGRAYLTLEQAEMLFDVRGEWRTGESAVVFRLAG